MARKFRCGAEDSPAEIRAHAAEGRDDDYAAAVPHRRQRISAEWQAVPAARHSGHLHGHRPGPESYAIIGQERIGQLLSSKPHDRRAIIEEAAGITRFKTKKRLAELRLEQAKQNLARVNDIFDEVTRQMGSLKRQAAKAERYGLLRDETAREAAGGACEPDCADGCGAGSARSGDRGADGDRSTRSAERWKTMDAEHAALTARGYELDRCGARMRRRRRTSARWSWSARARHQTNQERVAELDARMAAAQAELGQATRASAGGQAGRETQQKLSWRRRHRRPRRRGQRAKLQAQQQRCAEAAAGARRRSSRRRATGGRRCSC